MATGPRTVRTRRNARSTVPKQKERRGGDRKSHLTPEILPREKIRALLIERLEITTKKPKELGKHWIDAWVKFVHNPGQSPVAMKLFTDIFNLIAFEQKPKSGAPPFMPKPKSGEEEETAAPDGFELPPLMPDPARKVA